MSGFFQGPLDGFQRSNFIMGSSLAKNWQRMISTSPYSNILRYLELWLFISIILWIGICIKRMVDRQIVLIQIIEISSLKCLELQIGNIGFIVQLSQLNDPHIDCINLEKNQIIRISSDPWIPLEFHENKLYFHSNLRKIFILDISKYWDIIRFLSKMKRSELRVHMWKG